MDNDVELIDDYVDECEEKGVEFIQALERLGLELVGELPGTANKLFKISEQLDKFLSKVVVKIKDDYRGIRR